MQMKKHMLLAPVAAGQAASSWGGKEDKLQKLKLSLLLGGSSLAGPLGRKPRWPGTSVKTAKMPKSDSGVCAKK